MQILRCPLPQPPRRAQAQAQRHSQRTKHGEQCDGAEVGDRLHRRSGEKEEQPKGLEDLHVSHGAACRNERAQVREPKKLGPFFLIF